MADYDVGVLGLTSPPSLAVLQTYRPAVAVRNNGIHDALASGVLRIYSAGLLVFTSELYSAVIPPGETRDALAVGYWSPTAGTYIVIADVTCPLDQVESNNHLSPTTVIVSGELPPEPPTVPYHASQHEEGNADELIVDGLHGRLADAQAALAHKASHQVGGSDMISVDGLSGTLATPQPIADHHEAHEDHGGDELNVEGLQGVLYNLQKPQVHGNEKHDPNYATSTELSNHLDDTTAVHAVATNLEQVSRKGDPDGYPELNSLGVIPVDQLAPTALTEAGDALTLQELGGAAWGNPTPAEHGDDKHDATVASLGENGYVPVSELGVEPIGVLPGSLLRHDQTWGDPPQGLVNHHETHEAEGDDELDVTDLPGLLADTQRTFGIESDASFGSLIQSTDPETTLTSAIVPTAWWTSAIRIRGDAYLHLDIAPGAPTAILRVNFKQDSTILQQIDYNVTDARSETLHISAHLNGQPGGYAQAMLELLSDNDSTHASNHRLTLDSAASAMPGADSTISITAQFVGAPVGTSAVKRGGAIAPISQRP